MNCRQERQLGRNQTDRRRLPTFAVVGTLALLTACAGPPQRKFRIDAINTSEKPVACLVVVGDDWAGAAEQNRVVNVGGDDQATLELTFDKPEISIIVAAIPMNESTGEIDALPTSRSNSTASTSYIAGTRKLRVDDAPTQLFILEQRLDGGR
ncbi:MAG: hypothetical protein NXI31_15090 [bacterium]|nr:hypothetical protein [bacterium]